MAVLRYQDEATGEWRSISYSGGPGPAGPTGPKGSKGPVGFVGPTGPTGLTGQAGPTGPQGVANPGAAGATGPTGPQGIQGPQGSPGAQGDKGSTGSPGGQGSTGGQGAHGDASDRWRMARGRAYCPAPSTLPGYSETYVGYGFNYSGNPNKVITMQTSKPWSEVAGVGVGDNDFAVNGYTRIHIRVYRSTNYGTYVDWVTWGTIY